ncbi:putative polysaccharide ABC transporter ATP binding subunit [Leptolyngbya sp. NIES-3755]|nr:putative polysaccharide ABC transporter ATP binding subunit [Leptolyngbya sp. NIES-3755]
MSMGDPIIRVENLSKRYTLTHQEQQRHATLRDALSHKFSTIARPFQRGEKASQTNIEEFWALKDVSFEIQQGDRVGIIGRNGAGKSTLLKILSRITEPTSGEIRIKGRVASLLEVGTGFHPELTGRENIFLNGAILGMSKAEIKRKFDEIVAFAEIEKFVDTPVKRYSSGMYVRLAFAVAAHLEPEVLIIDEVLAVGDVQFQKKCLGKMEDVAEEGRTVIYVSHNMETVLRLCNKAILLNKGSVQFQGNTTQAVNLYFKSGQGTTAQRQWRDRNQAPGDDIVRLVEAKVHDESGVVQENLDITQPIGITMVYEILKDNQQFTQSINLFNSHGIHILSSHDLDAAANLKPRDRGIYASTMWIPANFLAEGLTIISVAALEPEPFKLHFHELEAVAFNVVDSMNGTSARGAFLGAFPGVVRPILDWDTVRLVESKVAT